jgi:Ulp1 family protease
MAMQTLAPKEWLGDGVIAFFAEVLRRRPDAPQHDVLWQPSVVELMCSLQGA